MNSLMLMSIIIFALIIFFVIHLIIAFFKIIQRVKMRSIEKRDLKQIEIMDKMLKPAEISSKIVINVLKETISKYIYSFYTGDISNLGDNVSPSIYNDIIKTIHEITEVTFSKLSTEQIKTYINEENVYDKAGAYAIQGTFCKYITKINGDYYNVMGLPIARVYKEIEGYKNEIQ